MGGYKLFKGIAMSNAAFKRKYKTAVSSMQDTSTELIELEANALLLELELLQLDFRVDTNKHIKEFVAQVRTEMKQHSKKNKSSFEKMAAQFGITNKTIVKELIELAIVEEARHIAHLPISIEERYAQIVALYHSQVNLSHRTSQSIMLQQYSTPAPIGYLAGLYCGIEHLHKTGGYAFEPSAGNGLLTVAAKAERCYVNEIDETRNENLRTQGFANVWKRDATIPFYDMQKSFVAVMTNPPFGRLDKAIEVDGYKIDTLDHLMAIRALDTMMANGKAAIIIGGHSHWDEQGRLQAGKNRIFFNFLYKHYQVEDVINIDGQKLYSRQGTSFNVRLILINGRKEIPEGVAPLFHKITDTIVSTFDDLFQRVYNLIN